MRRSHNAQRAEDERYMREALRLARRGLGRVEPNPMVGCVLVRGGRIIGRGYHRRYGQAHAEVNALRDCGGSARGATAYVTLEPCCHYGNTPPCTDALIAAGVRRVVAAMIDVDPRIRSKGVRRLRAAGIEVTTGVLRDEAVALNRVYLKLQRTRRPWVILKWAQSLDGTIATRTGDSKWISDGTCRHHAHRVRGRVDAILVGIETALRDDPLLTCRVGRPKRIATRIVLDRRLRLPTASRLVRTANDVPVWIVCGRDAPAARARRLEQAGCRVLRVRAGRGGLSLPALLDQLGRAAMSNLLVEGGGRVLGSFIDQRLADEVHAYIAPLLLGGRSAVRALDGEGPARVAGGVRLAADPRPRRLGKCWMIESTLSDADRGPTPH